MVVAQHHGHGLLAVEYMRVRRVTGPEIYAKPYTAEPT